MAPTVPDGFPASLTSGVTWKFTANFEDFPSSEGWALSFQLVGRASGSLSGAQVAARTATNDYLITAAPADTGAFTSGSYRWTAIATKAGETYVAASGSVDIEANPAVTTGADGRTFAAIQLEKVENELGARFGTLTTPLGSAHEAYTIGGRSITKIATSELTAMRGKLKAEVEMERSGGTFAPIEIEFGRPGQSGRSRLHRGY